MIRVVELFAGIGAQAQALEELGIEFTSTVCEIDPYAYRAYCAIHGDTPNLGDITKVEHIPDCDLLTYSFPCQDLSIAGRRRGMSEGSGTRSSLLWEVGRLLRDAVERERAPEVLLMENVDQILNGVNIKDFKRWIGELADMGYTSAYSVLNAKDFGVPQSRSRCFMVSMTKGRRYTFPEPCPDGRVMADILEDRPDESLYLSEKEIRTYERHRETQEEQGHGFGWPPPEPVGYAHALTTKPDRASQNLIIVCGDLNSPHRIDQSNRVHSDRGISPCVCANTRKSSGPLIEDVRSGKIRIRCLTPLECWRLQGFPDTAFRKAKEAGVSNAQLYRQAGNSIAVPCLKAIFKGIYIDRRWVGAPSLEAFA